MVLVSLSEIDRLICDEMERCAEHHNLEGYDVLNRLRDSIEHKAERIAHKSDDLEKSDDTYEI